MSIITSEKTPSWEPRTGQAVREKRRCQLQLLPLLAAVAIGRHLAAVVVSALDNGSLPLSPMGGNRWNTFTSKRWLEVVREKRRCPLQLAMINLEKHKLLTTKSIAKEAKTKTTSDRASVVFEKANRDYLQSCGETLSTLLALWLSIL